VIARLYSCILLCMALTVLPAASQEEPGGARVQLGYLATSLASGSPAEAMSVFDRSFPDYEKLSRLFLGLRAYQVQNEVEIEEELDTPTEAKLTVNWTLTLTDQTTSSSERRTGEIKIIFRRKNKSWKIVGFAPTDIFDPSLKR
jgi:hypothetical protein